MKAKVNFNDSGDVTQIKIEDNGTTVGYAEMNSSGAYLTTIYPFDGCDGINADTVGEMCDVLEALPFVEYAKFNYNPGQ